MMALPDRLPRAELRRQVSPGDAGAVTVDRTLNQIPMLAHRPAHSAFHRRQQRLDPSPHLIAEQRHTSHCCSIAPKRRSTLETRPSQPQSWVWSLSSAYLSKMCGCGPSSYLVKDAPFHSGGLASPLRVHTAWRAAPSATYSPASGTSTPTPKTCGAIRRMASEFEPPP